ncbi:NUDIX hydrolase [Sinosporangium siamense]|uniref:DNA mismatch repair protein MutT n=1 Tax=Sinosporangium siamense TaxID=1367973 RepID=A0A919R9E6_9ACTN|nr:NUDIX hydrolase [Sinosporangium siamense]GII89773.1 DNA mismatch repair protein MutT [Sinosporangium siamense]
MLVEDDAGNALTAFYPVGNEVSLTDGPTPFALVAVWCEGRLLLVFNRLRGHWELPGGMVDPGESLQQAAVRELEEESGLHVAPLVLVGYARFMLGVECRVEYGGLYTATVLSPHTSFTPNEEISAITWWDCVTPLKGRVHPIDAYLGALTRLK